VHLKKRILRTVLHEIIVQSERESRTHRLILHWAGGVHTELSVERNPSGQHRRQAERTVIDLVSELAKVCPDKAIAAILNRLGYKTGQEKNWNASRVAGLRGYHHIEPFQKQDGWVTREQAAEELKVSNTVVRRLIREQTLPATQVVQCAPWVIERKDLTLPAVQAEVQAVHNGRRLPPIVRDQAQLPLE
jgi:Helix-turn-helix domain